MDALAWPDLVGRRPLVLLPLGAVEQHGPHLPLSTDTAVAAAVAERAAALLRPDRDVLVAPAQPYGASGEHEDFPGTVSIGHTALHLLLLELGRSVLRWAGGLLVVNGHGGNAPSVAGAVKRLRAEGRDAAWWPCAPAGGDAHAGRTETSLVLALRPDAVRGSPAPGPTAPLAELMPRLVGEGVRAVSPTGVLGDPAGAGADEGRALLTGLAADLAAAAAAWAVGEHGRLARPVAA